MWVWIGTLVCVSAAIRFAIAQNYPGPWIFHDEIAYSDLARNFGRTGSFAIRDVAGSNGFGIVYPALISPAYALFDHVPTAYEAARAINALLMSLVAVPAYLLARRLVCPAFALAAAVLTVALPSMTYTTTIMTENAFYPLFVLVALAMYLALERPTILRQLMVFPPIVIAFYTRAQAIMFVPAILSAIVLVALFDAWFERDESFLLRLRRRLTAYWVIWAVIGIGAVGVVLVERARGRPLNTLLGSYGGVSNFHYHVGPIARWFVYHVAEMDLYVGIFPFAAFLFVTTGLLYTERTRSLRIFAAVSAPIVFWFAVTVSAYAANPIGNRIEERNFFFVAPLLFISLLVWVDRGLPRRSLAATASILVASVLPGAVPYESIIDANAVSGTFGLLPLMKLEQWTAAPVAPHNLPAIVVLGAIAGGLILLALPRRFALAAPLIVLGYFALISAPIHGITERASIDSANAATGLRRDWIDRAVGQDADVAILFFATQAVPFWQDEFFNASVRRIYNLTGPYDGLPQTRFTPDPRTQLLVDAMGHRLHAKYVLGNQSTFPLGREVAQDPVSGLRLYRTTGRDVRMEEMTEGIYPDTWSGPSVGYQRFGCRDGKLIVTLTSDPRLHPYDQLVTVSDGTSEIARRTISRESDVGQRMVVPLQTKRGLCSITFTIMPTASPAQVLGNNDTRELGLRFRRIVYHPAR